MTDEELKALMGALKPKRWYWKALRELLERATKAIREGGWEMAFQTERADRAMKEVEAVTTENAELRAQLGRPSRHEPLPQGQALERANKAAGILENQMYKESFEMTREAIISRIASCPLAEVAAAEDLRKCLRLLTDVRANLSLALNQGKVISFRLEQERAAEDKRKRSLLPNYYR